MTCCTECDGDRRLLEHHQPVSRLVPGLYIEQHQPASRLVPGLRIVTNKHTVWQFLLHEQLLWLCPSVCPSVCHIRVLWQSQPMHCGYFDTTQKGNH